MQPTQLWALGDYATVGDRWAGAGRDLAARVVTPGDRVLDVATGAGVVAIAAATAGADVTGLDVAPALLAAARRRADAAGVTVRWVEADMTALPEPDEAYDTVLSAFGAMFAPDAPAMAAELVRVCRSSGSGGSGGSGGLVGVLAWTPESPFGQLAPVVSRFLAQPYAGPPVDAWGDPARVPSFFADLPVRVATEESTVDVHWPSLDVAVEEITTLVPGMIAARYAIEPTGAWPDAVAAVRDLFAAAGRSAGDSAGDSAGGSADDSFVLPVPYLTTLAQRH